VYIALPFHCKLVLFETRGRWEPEAKKKQKEASCETVEQKTFTTFTSLETFWKQVSVLPLLATVM
jgi:hypothetical protein